MSATRRLLTVLCIMGFCGAAVWSARDYYTLLRAGAIQTQFAVPFDLHLAAVMIVVFAGVIATSWDATRAGRDLVVGGLTLAVCVVTFPLAQMLCFVERVDSEPADAVVILGCLTGLERHEDDRLAERIRTGCQCYRDKRAAKVILCGQPGEDSVHEAMRKIASEMGVADGDLVLNTESEDTQSAVESTASLFETHGCARAIVVSQKFRLARLQLAFQRQGRDVQFVATDGEHPHKPDTAAYACEAAALWAHYLAPLTGRYAPL
jgi:vancomycin permeability regulator SanA